MTHFVRSASRRPTAPSSSSDNESPSPRSSEHSRKSTSPENSSSRRRKLSVDAEDGSDSCHERKRAKHKRQGRVVNVLRQQYSIQHWHGSEYNPDIRPSSCSASLSSNTLQAALSYHLVRASFDTLDFIASDNWHNVTGMLDYLRQTGFGEEDSFGEVVVATAMALGARTTLHSAITAITVADAAHLDHSELCQLKLGRRREAACLALANRAVALAEEGGFLHERSGRARALGSFMRAVLTCLTPSHSSARQLMLATCSHLDFDGPRLVRDHKMNAFYDAVTAYTLHDNPICTEADVQRFDGVPSAESLLTRGVPDSLAELGEVWEDSAIIGMRRLCALQLARPLPVTELEPTFNQLARLADLCLAILPKMSKLCYSKSASRVARDRTLGIMKLVSQFEVALYSQSRRHLKGRHTHLWPAAQLRFVRYIALLTRTVTCQDPSQAATHLAANQFMVLEQVPEWTTIAAESAAQHAQGEGPLVAAQFTRIDLDSLHEALKAGSAVFAALSEREREVGQGVARLDLAQARTGSGAIAGNKKREEAEFMVERAMEEILAN